MAKKGGNQEQSQVADLNGSARGNMSCCTWGTSEMEAIWRTLGKPLVVRVDAPEFRGGGVGEFLNVEENSLNAKSCGEEKGKEYTDIFIR